MKDGYYILIVMVFGLIFSGISSAELQIPKENIFTSLTPSPGSTTVPILSDSVSGYETLKTTTLPNTPDSKTPVIRYSNDVLPGTINSLIDHIDFQTSKDKKGQSYIYFKLPAPDASVNQSKTIADFIVSRKEWIGDRSLDSVNAEIYIHWVAENALPLFTTNPINEALYEQYVIGTNDKRPSPISPTHLGYNYAGLDKTNLMDQFLLTL
ncbi:MAG: hypothetical protein CVV33_01230 [Methanomicrobiales archaeon HGW-Methanomicrobiales-4]|nr:MAG: hypothetical protein CVV33_01230 [Methanomicrobiales archaeon HGW-Methanomicrobiales-4]